MEFDYDLVVIGAGSGGMASAKRAAPLGAKVALIEDDRVGGTCVIRGCVPKKIMSYAASTADTIKDAVGYGFNVTSSFNYKALATKRNDEVSRLEGMHQSKIEELGVSLFKGRGRLTTDPHTVAIDAIDGSTKTITGRYIVLATGGTPTMPPIQGNELAFTSDGVFDLEALPKAIAVIGGGYIGVEFASIFNALGSEVHLVVRRQTMLNGFDEDIRSNLTNEMQKRGVNFHSICNVEKIEQRQGRKKVSLDNGEELIVDEVLFATGRRPNSQNLGLEEAGIELDKAGAVIIDEALHAKGKHDHIFAVGDLTNRVNLTPVAIRDGRIVTDNLFAGTKRTINDADIGTAVFSIPPLGTVGLTEEQAIEKLGAENIAAYKAVFRPMINVLPQRDEKMLMKAVYDKNTNKLLGAHLMGRDAPEMIQFIAVAVKAGITIQQMQDTIPLHPTSAEEFVLLG